MFVARVSFILSAIAVASVTAITTALAQLGGVLTRDSFPIGDADGILCQVQDRSVGNPASQTIFDRRWAVVCRDNPRPVAEIFAFQNFDASA